MSRLCPGYVQAMSRLCPGHVAGRSLWPRELNAFRPVCGSSSGMVVFCLFVLLFVGDLIFWIRILFFVYGPTGEPRVPKKVKMRNELSVVRSHEARSSSGMSFRVAARNANIFPYGLSQLACTLFRFACTVWTLRSKPLALPPPFPPFNDKQKKVTFRTGKVMHRCRKKNHFYLHFCALLSLNGGSGGSPLIFQCFHEA